MLTSLAGKRARITVIETGATIPVKILNTVGTEAVCTPEFRHSNNAQGKLIVESYSEKNHIIFPAQTRDFPAEKGILFQALSQPIIQPTDTELSFFLNKVPVQIKHNFKKIITTAVAGGPEGMAIELSAEIPAQTKLPLTILEEGREIETEGYVTHCHPKGKQFIAIYRFAGLSRVESMYWNRLVKSA